MTHKSTISESDVPARSAAVGRPRRSYEATEQLVHIAFALALICMGAIAIAAHRSVVHLRDQTGWVEHTREVLNGLGSLYASVVDAQNRLRGYTIVGDPQYLDGFADAARRVGKDVQRVEELTAGDVETYLGFANRVIETRQQRGLDAARLLILTQEGERFHTDLRDEVHAMQVSENALLEERKKAAARSGVVTDAAIVGGSVLGVILVGVVSAAVRRDLTGRRQAEAELVSHRENLQVTLDSIGDAVIATDVNGRITQFNRVAERLSGWKTADALGEPLARVLHLIDEKTDLRLPIPSQQDVADGIAHLPGECAIISRTGTQYSVEENVTPITDDTGTAVGGVWVLRDVTDARAAIARRKQAEEELERFFTLSIDFLAISSSDGYFKRVSPGVTPILGWTPEEFIARPYMELVHPDDRTPTAARIARQLEGGERVLQFENRYLHKDGSWRLLSWRSAPYAGGLMYGAARDVTDRRRVEQEVKELNAELRKRAEQVETANRELETFAYSVSHDLRAPLRHIEGYVDLLRQDGHNQLSAESAQYLEVVAKSIQRLNALISDLLEPSQLDTIALRITDFDATEVVLEVRDGLTARARGEGIDWTIEPMPRVRGDRVLIKQAFANLMANAIQYSRPQERPAIAIGCAGREGPRVILFVRDNGVGFEPAQAGRRFGAFERLHQAGDFEGEGIGLAKVHRIIGRHGGRVWAESGPEAGATFYFTIEEAGSA